MILSGPLAAPVADRLAELAPDLATRLAPAGPVPADDLAWADSWSGFELPENLAGSPVRWVHSMAAGVDAMVGALVHAPGPLVLTRTVGAMPARIGTYVLAHVLDDALRLGDYRAQQARGQWRQLPAEDVAGRTGVVLGTGAIGSGVAAALRGAGLRVVGASRSGAPRPAFDDVLTLDGLPEVLPACDVLVCALPLTDTTRGLVGEALLGRLGGALVVNVGRGACVDPGALRRALAAGRVRRAVLDVVETEPLPAGDWRWSHPAVTLTPHISGPTQPGDVAPAIARNRALLAAGVVPETAVDLRRGY
ncbi:D-2-hydroxyacid dehydrogenase [Georgenia ruanii]|uniref:D-2-hydroxyacid dehydrogenase n=2 Tax=Georgenia ruanii TaxID=348442 RepID=A0A7J9UVV5_9MICO|nr:D-2-hydroxyacid dehydrogenase [Georgenia ruanii]